eukprot:CAMPEP_0202880166 /NCGR_PEP_ID=MMETSP1391-20130828/34713_1 /ASSEMBLY_ACC=CAM_ASM_000867 /TAXON_ID=1034604 /ORGANISM="Chlamydomonas leiostraca, Strain SAG 11-49" /LENGTH=108 /DNA_ID=CAMNT_0049562633 /DNA_START=124 /DNA_END=445 /DNA_ORIENTATION=-
MSDQPSLWVACLATRTAPVGVMPGAACVISSDSGWAWGWLHWRSAWGGAGGGGLLARMGGGGGGSGCGAISTCCGGCSGRCDSHGGWAVPAPTQVAALLLPGTAPPVR